MQLETMNAPDPIPLTRTSDAGLNIGQILDPHASANTLATWAVLINRGLITPEELRDTVMRAKAVVPK